MKDFNDAFKGIRAAAYIVVSVSSIIMAVEYKDQRDIDGIMDENRAMKGRVEFYEERQKAIINNEDSFRNKYRQLVESIVLEKLKIDKDFCTPTFILKDL